MHREAPLTPGVLALDLGTTFGFAFSDGRSGAHRLPSSDRRYYEFMVWLGRNVGPEVKVVAYERVRRHLGTDAAHVYGGLRAVLIAFCDANGKRHAPVAIQAIKRHATGRGNAKKPEMIAAAQARGWAPVNDDHADALWLLDYWAENDDSE